MSKVPFRGSIFKGGELLIFKSNGATEGGITYCSSVGNLLGNFLLDDLNEFQNQI